MDGFDDDRLLDALRGAAGRVDPVPPAVLDGARQTFTWRTIDAELAELGMESAMDSPHDEERMLDELRQAAARIDPVPEAVLAAARDAFTWRTIDAELAQLTYDSLLDERPLAGVRGWGPRTLSFSGGGITVEVEVAEHGRQRAIEAQLVPSRSAEVTVDHAGGRSVVRADELGRFAVDDVEAGRVRLRIRFDDRSRVPALHTEWISV